LDDTTAFRARERVWTWNIRTVWETFLRDDRALTVARDAYRAGRSIRNGEDYDGEADYFQGERMWSEGDSLAQKSFKEQHHRFPFPYEDKSEILKNAFATGLDGDEYRAEG
jgi:hypothetical protein